MKNNIGQIRTVHRCHFIGLILLCVYAAFPAKAGFSSIYIFGDSLSTTTTNNATGSITNLYYGQRYSNGRSWIEVFAQRQGFGANSITNLNWSYSSNNLSFYGQYSPILVTNVSHFSAPPDASNDLFVIWVDNADFVGDLNNINNLNTGPPNGTNLSAWTVAINSHLTNHFRVIANLYAKGVRTLVMPNVADITTAPEFNASPAGYKTFVRQRIINFNTNYVAMLSQIAASSPGLTIYVPDIFSLLDNILTNAAGYGLTNALQGGLSIDAVDSIPSLTRTNNPGTNYIFWDPISPSAKLHAVIADAIQQTISPVQISGISPSNGNIQLNLSNVPIGLNGVVEGKTNLLLANWTATANINSTNTTQTIFISPAGQQQFYRLRFPYAWSWP